MFPPTAAPPAPATTAAPTVPPVTAALTTAAPATAAPATAPPATAPPVTAQPATAPPATVNCVYCKHITAGPVELQGTYVLDQVTGTGCNVISCSSQTNTQAPLSVCKDSCVYK